MAKPSQDKNECPASSYDFNQNRGCRFFPCHPGADPATFNCKHCYCPLYFIYWKDCGGTFEMLPNGVKDCTPCVLPHQPGGHAHVVNKLKAYFSRLRSGSEPCRTSERDSDASDPDP